jgi:hypothetical protein
MSLTICPPFRCWFCPPTGKLANDYISLIRDCNKVWCGTCGNFLGHDIIVPDQLASLLKSLFLDCNMHLYRKPSNNVPVRASGQDVNVTAIDLIDRAYNRFNMEISWFELLDPEHTQCPIKEGKPMSDQPLFLEVLPDPVKPALRKFLSAGYYLTQANMSEKKKVLRLEHRFYVRNPQEPKCLVVRAEVKWPEDLLNPPPEPVKQVIPKAAAKKIFFEAAQEIGVPTPQQFPKATADPQKLTAALEAVLEATRKSMLTYLPDGEELSLEEQTDWNAEIFREAGWKVVVALDKLSFTSGYPDSSC